MKRIITAMANNTLNNELKKYDKYDVITEDLYYQEAVLDILYDEKFDVLIISALLQGQFEFCEFIEMIRKIDKIMRIIVVTDSITEEFKARLNSNDITDIFIDSEIDVKDILDSIDREEPIRKKYELVKEVQKTKYIAENNENDNTILSKKYINETKNNVITQKQEIIVATGNKWRRKIYNYIKFF